MCRTHRGAAPPGPRPARLAGNLAAFEADRLGFLEAMRDDYGPLAAFDRRTTVISDPALVDVVLRTQASSFAITKNFLGQTLDPGDLSEIVSLRPVLNPGLREARLDRLRIAVWRRAAEAASSSATLLPLPLAEQAIAEAVGEHFFGADAARVTPQVAALLDELEQIIGNPFALPPSRFSARHRRIAALHAQLRADVMGALRRRTAPADDSVEDVATEIVRANTSSDSPGRLADLLIGALLASQRVPAAAAAWTLQLLAEHPHEQAALLPEAAAFARAAREGRPPPTRLLPHALAAVTESLRLYPPTWLTARTATTPVRLGAYSFPRGHTFLISSYVLHRDRLVYARPDTFVPGRWPRQVPAGSYIPFGRGMHRCPGSDLATAAVQAFVLGVLSHGQVRITQRGSIESRNTLRPAGLELRVDAVPIAAALQATG